MASPRTGIEAQQCDVKQVSGCDWSERGELQQLLSHPGCSSALLAKLEAWKLAQVPKVSHPISQSLLLKRSTCTAPFYRHPRYCLTLSPAPSADILHPNTAHHVPPTTYSAHC